MIFVLGGEVDLYPVSGNTIVIPAGYGMCFDPSGEELDLCSVFIGPIQTTDELVEEIPSWAKAWFGSDYVAKKARIDIPDRRWNSVGRVKEITYYRPGRYAADWNHKFSKPVTLFHQGRWWKLKLPRDCKITWRGIEKP